MVFEWYVQHKILNIKKAKERCKRRRVLVPGSQWEPSPLLTYLQTYIHLPESSPFDANEGYFWVDMYTLHTSHVYWLDNSCIYLTDIPGCPFNNFKKENHNLLMDYSCAEVKFT